MFVRIIDDRPNSELRISSHLVSRPQYHHDSQIYQYIYINKYIFIYINIFIYNLSTK